MMTMVISGSDGVTFPDSTNQFSGGAFSFKNRIINGGMVIAQRNSGSVTPTSDNTYNSVDRWVQRLSQASKYSVQQSTTAPAGFTNSMLITSLAATSVGAADFFGVEHRVEGFNSSDLGWGTANAKTVTLSFWVRSSLTGTFGGSFINGNYDRSYPFTYTISSANTFEYKTITIVGDTTGTWNTTNGSGIQLSFGLGVGANNSGTAGAWAGAGTSSATGAVSVVGTNGATWYITGVQLEVGSVATPFERRPYGTELALCQRYYYRITAPTSGTADPDFGVGWNESTTVASVFISFPVSMRLAPSALEQTGTASNYQIVHTNTATTCSSVPVFEKGATWGSRIRGTVSSGLTAGQGSAMRANNNSAAYLAWSAEL